jgi:hypothetical protein
MNQQQLNEYFKTQWIEDFDKYPFSGPTLRNKVADSESVIDVGCGHNPFVGKIKNLIGIDPAFAQAHVNCTIEEYVPSGLFDVAFCLGSINFGNETKIRCEIEKVISILKPRCRIYWRCNPGRHDHKTKDVNQIEFFNWSIDYHKQFCADYGFTLADTQFEYPDPTKERIYAEWTRGY